ncbi:hypothetical protein [Flocculibacter collagenilyticus]|uniref:hypothetical protein n=1 Tax=Flocculibacter collagenilyticus TaxID=2744479 RepID=UPI0018F30960|nr:hypothetical protein [Flocculibacter collagenilyticus]
MKSDALFSQLKSKFIVTNADMGNLPHRTRLEENKQTGESILSMPKKVYGDYAEVGDVISFNKASKCRIKLINLSCKVKKWASFVREYNSICRQMKSSKHPLNRVIVEFQGMHYLVKAHP